MCSLLAPTATHAAVSPPPYAARNIDSFTVRVVVEAPEEPRFAHLSWPKAVRAKDGTIVLAYIAGIFHGDHGGGSPAVSLSTDNGATFSEPHVLREFVPGKDYSHSGNLALGVAEDGALVLLAMAFNGDDNNHIFGWRSSDNGKSWLPTDTSSLGPNKTGSVFGNILPVAGQGLVVLGHYRKGANPYQQGTWMAVSSDNGLSWSEPRRISEAATAEPMLVQSGDALLAFLRAIGDGGRQSVIFSNDKGLSWSTAPAQLSAENPATHSLAAPWAAENPVRPGEVLALTTERGRDMHPGSIWLWRGDVQELMWRRERKLLEFPKMEGDEHRDFGYPWLIYLENRRWLMFYYHGLSRGSNSIWSTEVEL